MCPSMQPAGSHYSWTGTDWVCSRTWCRTPVCSGSGWSCHSLSPQCQPNKSCLTGGAWQRPLCPVWTGPRSAGLRTPHRSQLKLVDCVESRGCCHCNWRSKLRARYHSVHPHPRKCCAQQRSCLPWSWWWTPHRIPPSPQMWTPTPSCSPLYFPSPISLCSQSSDSERTTDLSHPQSTFYSRTQS